MSRGRPWLDHEYETARTMKVQGYTLKEIGADLGRSPEAVRLALNRSTASTGCLTQEQYDRDAAIGSQRLLEAMLKMGAMSERDTEISNLSEYANVPFALAEMVWNAAAKARIPLKTLRSNCKRTDLVNPRWAVAKEARDQGYSYPVIGRALNRDHTSILHAVREMAARA